MTRYNEVYIYFDTNALECRHSGKSLFLSQIKLSPLYYDVENLIKNFDLTYQVHICIPEVVWLEMLAHMQQCYRAEKQVLSEMINKAKKTFGDLLDIDYKFVNADSDEKYVLYLDEIAQDFIDNKRIIANIISCPSDEEIMKRLLDKATHMISPFKKARGNNKEYTDAGFKDALILETMLLHSQNGMGILISNDNDFNGAFDSTKENAFYVCKSISEVQELLVHNFNLNGKDVLEAKIRNNVYLFSRILEETGFDNNANCVYVSMEDIKESEIGYEISLMLRINGNLCNFVIIYDSGANELISVEYLPEEMSV